MSWNASGMEPGGEPPDEVPPIEPRYPATYGTQHDLDTVPSYLPDADEPAEDDRSGAGYTLNPRYGGGPRSGADPRYPPDPGYAPDPRYAPDPGYAPDPRYVPDLGYSLDTDALEPEYGPPDADDDEELPPSGRTVTPLRLVALVALVVSGAVAAISLLVLRGDQSIAITVASLAIFGLMSTFAGIAFAAAGVRGARAGSLGRAVLGGLIGGLFVLVAAGAVASSVIFLLLSRP